VAEIFVSYTSKDRDWAFWIGQELEKLGHKPRIDAWEIPGGGDIARWTNERIESVDHVLGVISKDYVKGPLRFLWDEFLRAKMNRTNFFLPVRIKDCALPLLLDSLKRCDLFGVNRSLRASESSLMSTVFCRGRTLLLNSTIRSCNATSF